MRISFLMLLAVILGACDNNPLKVELESEAPLVQIRHYDEQLFESNPYKLELKLDSLAQKFPAFINGDYKNSAKIDGLIEYVENPLNRELYRKSKDVFQNMRNIEADLISGFHHYQYYFPVAPIPDVYFYISGLNYESPIIVTPNNEILIGKDLFLGSDYKVYGQYQIPQFVSQKFDKQYLPYEVFRTYAYKVFGKNLQANNLLEHMISLGKVEYFIHAMYPESSNQERFAFTDEQIIWCNDRIPAFWKYLAEEQLLFSKDYHEYKKFIEDRPFVSSLERSSPGRAGVFVGYQIVQDFMKNTSTSLPELMMIQDQMLIFNASKYNP
jgi:hypothetical protein